MNIRKARVADIGLIAPLIEDYEKANLSYVPPKYKALRSKKKPFSRHIRFALRKDITQRDSLFLIAEEDGKVLGYIFGEFKDEKHPLFNKPRMGELNDIAVLQTHRGKGIAGELWKELLSWFVKKNCKMIALNVNSNNPTQNIYRKWGFEPLNIRMIRKL